MWLCSAKTLGVLLPKFTKTLEYLISICYNETTTLKYNMIVAREVGIFYLGKNADFYFLISCVTVNIF